VDGIVAREVEGLNFNQWRSLDHDSPHRRMMEITQGEDPHPEMAAHGSFQEGVPLDPLQ
jgi:hypothetical protein